MGGSARYRFMKKLDRLQQKYGVGYSNNPDYLKELDEARQKFVEQRMGEIDRANARTQAQQQNEVTASEGTAGETRNNGPYSENYSQERLNDALWTNDKQKVDDGFRESSGKWWNSLSEDQKDAMMYFTDGEYDRMNLLLGGKLGPMDYGYDSALERIGHMTAAMDTSETPEDIWVRRGVSDRHLNRLFGFGSINDPISDRAVEIRQAIADGKIFDVDNFMSSSGSREGGFEGVEMRIFVPKGSKAVYAEPFSVHGDGAGREWDGKSTQSNFSHEFEIVLQRGYKLKPIAYNPGGGRSNRAQIVFTIVGQETRPVERQEIDWSKVK